MEKRKQYCFPFPLMPARSPKCKPMIETKQKAEIELPKIRGTEELF